MRTNRYRLTGLSVLLLAFALLLPGCGGSAPESPAPTSEPATPPSRPEASATPGGEGAPEPPSGGDIIIGPGGYSFDNNGIITSIGYDTASTSSLFIPQGFTGSVSGATFRPSSGAHHQMGNQVTLDFPSGAGLRLTKGTTAQWDCKASGGTFSTCVTQVGNTIGSAFKVTADDGTTTTVKSGRFSHAIDTGSSVKIY